ncbi:sensor histidine kinase [Microbacterium sp. SD291]|uniref:sensor histidine kinase n=1 Tax=Microbacterium sp. SD291 TaxID=2782007 RepID=UPI001A96E349|nr:sensor histidine kinase [Microbacterium sp. SD291]MBO0981657.1 sensor histidine kinase [Microbacterium sp. SD291]
MRNLVWSLAVIVAIALALSVFAVLDTRPVPWPLLAYLLTTPIPMLVVGIYLLFKQHTAGLLLTLATCLGTGGAAALEVLIKARMAENGIEPWMPWALLVEPILGAWSLSCIALLIGLFPACVPETPGQRLFARAMWWLPAPMLLALLSHPNVLVERFAFGELPPVPNPAHIPPLAVLAPATVNVRELLYFALIGALVLLVIRYRRETAARRRQIRWVLFGVGAAMMIGLVPFLIQPLLGTGGPVHDDLFVTLSTFAVLLFPLSLLFALEPPAWMNADAVLRKSFIYGALSLGILAVYAAIAAAIGVTATAGFPVGIAIAVTAGLAFAFHPVRERLRRLADRWVFGSSPAKGMDPTEPGDLASHTPEEIGRRLALLIRSAVRLEWVEVALIPDVDCAAGVPSGDAAVEIPLLVDGADLGLVRCGPKLTGRLTERDLSLITALAHQSALLLANRRLAGRLVQAQESERRRIERNLHDGAQQELVALAARLGLVRNRIRNGESGDELLAEMQQEVRTILHDVRELAQGIHPTVLSDGGLVEAVEDRCNRLPVSIRVTASTGLRATRFDDDIEGAAYFFVAECLTNTLKHADATRAHVDLVVQGDELRLTVTDDGIGFDPVTASQGGLTGLRDRFAALAGRMTVTSAPDAGTTIRAALPVSGGGER